MIAITTGLILLSGTIAGSAPMVFADHSDDLKDKLAKLKDLIAKWKAKKKCPENKKYNGECDKKKPKIKIEFPEKRDCVAGPMVMITGTASDKNSGIKEILVKVDRGSFVPVDEFDPETGEWKITLDLDNGRHFVFAKAIDKVDNKKRDFSFFTVDPTCDDDDDHDDSNDDSALEGGKREQQHLEDQGVPSGAQLRTWPEAASGPISHLQHPGLSDPYGVGVDG